MRHDEWFYNGDEETYTTLDNAAAVDATIAEIGLVTIPSTDHGFKASDNNVNSLIYIQGTTNYDGLRKIYAVATDTITIYAKFVAETFAGTETIKTMYSQNEAYELLGFEATLSSASATSENLTVIVDAAAGASWDNELYTNDMNTVKYVNKQFDPPIKCSAGDKIDIAWANTNDRTWGIKILTRRLS